MEIVSATDEKITFPENAGRLSQIVFQVRNFPYFDKKKIEADFLIQVDFSRWSTNLIKIHASLSISSETLFLFFATDSKPDNNELRLSEQNGNL